MAVALLVALSLAVVLVVALPLLREPAADDRIASMDDAARARLRVREERDDALVALADLEFDRRTGKVADEDYTQLTALLRGRVAAALVLLDREPVPEPQPDAITAAP